MYSLKSLIEMTLRWIFVYLAEAIFVQISEVAAFIGWMTKARRDHITSIPRSKLLYVKHNFRSFAY